jgi:integrase
MAGLGKIHVHQLRHSYAHAWLRDGGSEESLMRHLGWKSREMLSRYAASAGEERARALNRRVGLGARF